MYHLEEFFRNLAESTWKYIDTAKYARREMFT